MGNSGSLLSCNNILLNFRDPPEEAGNTCSIPRPSFLWGREPADLPYHDDFESGFHFKDAATFYLFNTYLILI